MFRLQMFATPKPAHTGGDQRQQQPGSPAGQRPGGRTSVSALALAMLGLASLIGAATCGAAAASAQSAPTAASAQSATTKTLAATPPPPLTAPVGIGQASDGNFYSISARSGCADSASNVCAFIYKTTPAGVVSTFHTFQEVPQASVQINADGLEPTALLEGADGNLYGACASGGAYGAGTIFKIALDGTFTVLVAFPATTNGGALAPEDVYDPTSLIQGADGNLYGTANMAYTSAPGAFPVQGGSVLFQVTTSGAVTVIHRFLYSEDSQGNGSAPEGWTPSSIVQADDGNFYVTMSGTQFTSPNRYGAIDQVSPSGYTTVLFTFAADGSEGSAPTGPLVEGSDGNLYGTTLSNLLVGNTSTPEFAYKLTRSGVMTELHQFTGGADGTNVPGGMLLGSDGNFYGTTSTGGNTTSAKCSHTGTPGCGTLFQLQPSGVLTTLYTFSGGLAASLPPPTLAGIDGAHPHTPLVQTQTGVFFGTTAGDSVYDANGSGTFPLIQQNSGTVFDFALATPLPPPVQLSFSVNGQPVTSVLTNTAVTVNWKVLNAFSLTAQQCHASIQGSPLGAGKWSGPQTGSLVGVIYSGTAVITPLIGGIYTYVLSCGGNEIGTATLSVSGVTITTPSLPDGVVNIPYTAAVQAVGGITPYTWGSSGALPAGLALNSTPSYTTVNLTGTPTQFGKYQVSIAVQDSSNPVEVGLQTYTVNIASGLSLVGSLNNGTVGTAYNMTATATGGLAPYKWALASGKLPTGLTLNTSSGVISGTPTVASTFPFSIQVTDGEVQPATFTQSYVVSTVVPPLTVVPPDFPDCFVGVLCQGQYMASGGTPPYTWTFEAGYSGPPGLTLSADGLLSGLPLQYNTLPPYGNFGRSVSVQVTDSSSPPLTVANDRSINIYSGLKIVSIPLPTATVGLPYQAPPPVATGGVPPYTWTIAFIGASQLFYEYGAHASIGALYSIPTGPVTAGTFEVLYGVTDSETNPAATANMDTTLTVVPMPVTSATMLSSSNASAGAGMPVTLTAVVTATASTPTGTVTFYNGSAILGTGTLDATGTATLTTSFAAPGVYSLTAAYAGAGAIMGSTSAALTETVVTVGVTASVNPTSLTIASGSSGTLTITVTPMGGYAGTVNFSCGTLPAQVSCTFAPPSLTLTAGGGPATATLTINTGPALAARLSSPSGGTGILSAGLLIPGPLLALGLLFRRRRKPSFAPKLFLLAFACLALAGAGTLAGCAGGSSVDAKPGIYTVPVTLTLSSGTAQTVNAVVVVQ